MLVISTTSLVAGDPHICSHEIDANMLEVERTSKTVCIILNLILALPKALRKFHLVISPHLQYCQKLQTCQNPCFNPLNISSMSKDGLAMLVVEILG